MVESHARGCALGAEWAAATRARRLYRIHRRGKAAAAIQKWWRGGIYWNPRYAISQRLFELMMPVDQVKLHRPSDPTKPIAEAPPARLRYVQRGAGRNGIACVGVVLVGWCDEGNKAPSVTLSRGGTAAVSSLDRPTRNAPWREAKLV